MSESWHSAVAEAEFPEEGKATAILNGWHVLIAKTDDGYHAVNDRCTHAASHLSGGRIRRGAVMCPLHGARFELSTGKCIGGTYRNVRTFPIRVIDGMIEVGVPEAKPQNEDLPIAF
jgi:3-phenylpropionate/trans-cinnamate dioxygenase ferredoxin subunit